MVRRLSRIAITLVVLIVLAFAAAALTTDRFLASRWLVWQGADTGDVNRFPARRVDSGTTPLQLPRGTPLELDKVWPSAGDPEKFLERSDTTAFLVLQHGAIRYEKYFNGARLEDLRTSFSGVKSLVSTLIGIAIAEGKISSLDVPVTEYVPELAEHDPDASRITLRHLLTMSSGLRYREGSMPWTDDTRTYYGIDLRKVALSAKVEQAPGRRFLYNNYNLLLEGLVLERATGMSVSQLLSEKLWAPMGAEADATWSLDSSSSGFEKMESGLNARARDYARFGQLFLRSGAVNGRQVVPRDWVRQATSSDAAGGPAAFYGLHWWTGRDDGWLLPSGHFVAIGNFGQFVYVAPDQDLVIVRLGDDWGDASWLELLAGLAEHIGSE